MNTGHDTAWLPLVGVIFFLIVLPLIFIWSSWGLQGGAGTIPLFMSGLMLFSAVMSLGLRVRAGTLLPGWKKSEKPPLSRLLAICLFLAAFYPLASWLGFYAMAFVYVVWGYFFFAKGAGVRGLWGALATAVCFTLCAWLLFYKGLRILTPTGILF